MFVWSRVAAEEQVWWYLSSVRLNIAADDLLCGMVFHFPYLKKHQIHNFATKKWDRNTRGLR